MRWIGRIAIGLAAVTVAAALALYAVFRASLPELDGQLEAPRISEAMKIERDALGVVTIEARSRTDAAFGLGFAHAQDRFFQMDLARRAASGRLAELFGDVALEVDLGHRRHQFEAVAGQVLVSLPPQHRAVLEAYAAGANAGLESLGARPFEYILLRNRPSAWSARDCLLVVFAMYLQLNDSEASIDRQRGMLADVLPRPMFDFIDAFAPEWEAPIDGNVAPVPAVPSAEIYDLRSLTAPTGRRSAMLTSAAVRGIGSNNWALAGTRTASGSAIVANDMHLGLGVPNSWYRVRMRFGGTLPDLAGVTLPGTPNLVAGSNGWIAWGFTNSYGDYSDLALIEISANGDAYRTTSGWAPLQHHPEQIHSASGRVQTQDILSTEWGPLLDGEFKGRRLALEWTAHYPEATNLRWLELEAVNSVQAALDLAPSIGGPVQNFVVGDRAGHIGWTLLGRLPSRGAVYDPRIPAERSGKWHGWLAPADYPRMMDPSEGQLWSANNRVVGGEALARIGDGSPDRGARARQIRDALRGLSAPREADMLGLQLDDRAIYLGHVHDWLLDVLDEAAVANRPARLALRDVVKNWDARASVHSSGYRLVRTAHNILHRDVFEMLVSPVAVTWPAVEWQVPRHFGYAVTKLLEEQPMHLLDSRYASWREFELEVVDDTIAQLEFDCPDGLDVCEWGDYNVITIRHPLSRALPSLSEWLDMSREPTSGDHDMPRVHGPGFGAAERFAVTPGSESSGYFHMPAGQSGHPLSPYYRAGHEAWVRGEPLPFLPGPATSTLELRPAR